MQYQSLEQRLVRAIDQLELPEFQKDFLRDRWLDQLLWLERRAVVTKRQHFRLRAITVIGGTIIPALVSSNHSDGWLNGLVNWLVFLLSQSVAISAAWDELFHYGDDYRRYRLTAETLKTEGWQFFQLSGFYGSFESHSSAMGAFCDRTEAIIQQDLQGFAALGQQGENKRSS